MPWTGLRRLLFFFIIFLYAAVLYADTVSDSDITANILKNYSNNLITMHLPVKVITQNGIVSLKANVNPQQAVALLEVAAATEGVIDVETSQLLTAAGPLPLDTVLTAKVRGALVREHVFGEDITLDNLPITVKTTGAIVYFFGMADNYSQITTAIKLAYSIRGVQRVISSLGVPFQRVRMGG